MKNILAENLLRFGVKNLSEADKLRLEQKTPTAGGGGAVAGKTPAAVKPAQGKKVVASFKMSVGGGAAGQQSKGITECSVYGILTKDPKTGKFLPPNELTLSLAFNGKFLKERALTFVLNKMANTYMLQPNQGVTNGPKLVEFLRYKTDQIESGSPATALMQVIENIKNETGVNVSIDSSVVSNIRSAYDVYWKSGITDFKKMNITQGVLKPFTTVTLKKYFNPETNQEYINDRMLSFGTSKFGYYVGKSAPAKQNLFGGREDFINFLTTNNKLPDGYDVLGKATQEAQKYYNQLIQ